MCVSHCRYTQHILTVYRSHVQISLKFSLEIKTFSRKTDCRIVFQQNYTSTYLINTHSKKSICWVWSVVIFRSVCDCYCVLTKAGSTVLCMGGNTVSLSVRARQISINTVSEPHNPLVRSDKMVTSWSRSPWFHSCSNGNHTTIHATQIIKTEIRKAAHRHLWMLDLIVSKSNMEFWREWWQQNPIWIFQ